MSATIMQKGDESKELASKLALMKNQIMLHDAFKGMQRKYAGVKINKLKDVPVVVSLIYLIRTIV